MNAPGFPSQAVGSPSHHSGDLDPLLNDLTASHRCRGDAMPPPRVDPVLANASHFHFPMRRPTGQLIWRYPRPGRRPLEPSSPPLQLGGGADKTAKDDDNRTIGPTPASISPQTLSTPLLEPKQSAPPCIREPSREHQTRKRGGIKGTQGNKAAYWPRRDNDPWTATGSADHRGWTRAEAWRLGG